MQNNFPWLGPDLVVQDQLKGVGGKMVQDKLWKEGRGVAGLKCASWEGVVHLPNVRETNFAGLRGQTPVFWGGGQVFPTGGWWW
jgi:hypothetical protein